MKDNSKDSARSSESSKSRSGRSSRKDKISFKPPRRALYGSYGGTDYAKGSPHSSNRFSVVESYKTLRTNLQFSLPKKDCNVLLITSTMPRDGKSTVAANVAVAFSQSNKRVLLIDADMRKPRLNKFFNIPAVPGLSNILAGLCPVSEGVHTCEFRNLSLIPSGILPPNPAELLMSGAMEELIAAMRLEYDLIVLDTPPVNIVSDAVVLTKVSDGVALVVRHAVTTHPDIEKAIKSLEFANAKILGIVLNAFNYAKIYGKRYGSYNYKKDKYGSYYGKSGYGNYGYGYGSHDKSQDPIVTPLGVTSAPGGVKSPADSGAASPASSAELPRPTIIPERVDRK